MLKKILVRSALLLTLLPGLSPGLAAQPSRTEGSMLSPGPDLIVSDIRPPQQFGSNGTQVALAMSPTACNIGDVQVHFYQLANTDHPVISQSIYRMSGGSSNTDRFEQIGEAWIKHAFGADQIDGCNLGCIPASNFAELGVGCSDTYDANWQDNAAQAAELTAAGLAPTNNLESGIAATLPPGAYTALLKGANNGTGVGLVEVYDRGAP